MKSVSLSHKISFNTNTNKNIIAEVSEMHDNEQLKQITHQLADVNFYRDPERFSELFNQFMSLSHENEMENWKNRITCSLPFIQFLEEMPLLALL